MGLFSKKIDDITIDDLRSLIKEKERESINLDYKKGINPSEDGKHDLIRHVVGMANTEGGYLVFGIEEDKENGIPIKLVGIIPSVGNQKVDEWMENVVYPHISPRVMIKIRTISLSSKKIAMVLWIPESTRRPHMSTFDNDFRIYRRYNTQTLPASEGEIREMYLRSNKIEKNLDDFMNRKNLTDPTSDQFAMTINSKGLLPQIQGVNSKELPMVVLSACPRFIEERIDIASDEINNIVRKNLHTKIENHDIIVFKPYDSVLDSNSITYTVSNVQQGNLLEYLEIQRNGFVEEGMTHRVIRNKSKQNFILHLGRTTVAIWAFINFVKNLYEETNYFDEFSIFLSIRNINQITLNGFYGISDRGFPWSSSFDDDLEETLAMSRPFVATTFDPVYSKTPRDQNFSYSASMGVSDLDEKRIFDIVKIFSTRLCNAFSLRYPPCYNHNDGRFVKIHLERYNNLFG